MIFLCFTFSFLFLNAKTQFWTLYCVCCHHLYIYSFREAHSEWFTVCIWQSLHSEYRELCRNVGHVTLFNTLLSAQFNELFPFSMFSIILSHGGISWNYTFFKKIKKIRLYQFHKYDSSNNKGTVFIWKCSRSQMLNSYQLVKARSHRQKWRTMARCAYYY